LDTPGLARKNAANCLILGFVGPSRSPGGAIDSPGNLLLFDDLKHSIPHVVDFLFHKEDLGGNQVLVTNEGASPHGQLLQAP
jgi:hypothetical protein